VTLDNLGGMPAPVDVVVEYADGAKETRHQTPAIWATNVKRATVTVVTSKPVRSISLAGGIFMDADAANDKWVAAK